MLIKCPHFHVLICLSFNSIFKDSHYILINFAKVYLMEISTLLNWKVFLKVFSSASMYSHFETKGEE